MVVCVSCHGVAHAHMHPAGYMSRHCAAGSQLACMHTAGTPCNGFDVLVLGQGLERTLQHATCIAAATAASSVGGRTIMLCICLCCL